MSDTLPKGWKLVKLGDVVIINPNESLKKGIIAKKVPMEALLPFTKKIQFFIFEKYNGGVKFKNGDTLVARITPSLENGKTVYVDLLDGDEIGFGSTEFIVLREKSGITDKQFIYYFAISNDFRDIAIKSMTGSSGRQRVQNEVVMEFEFPLPPLPEQKAIAEVLSSLDDKIDLLHRQNKTLEEMAMTLFRQWFIEPTKDGLPDGWEEVSLGEIIEISSGKSIEKGKLKEKGLYPVLGANGEIGRTDDWLYEGELIYTGRVGTLGNVFIVFKNEKVWLTDNTLVIKPKKNEYFYFVYFTLKNAKLDEYNSGSTQPLIRQSDIKKIEIFLPKINFLKDFEVISRNLFTKIQFNTSQIQTIKKLRDTLLPKLMSGEVRVKV